MSDSTQSPDCPYVGLAPFETAHADYFFGRTLDSAVLADNVMARRLCVLCGTSGVGKSSVLNVGLPKAIKNLGVSVHVALRRDWHDPSGLDDWLDGVVAEARRSSRLPLILILDQFEEFFLYLSSAQAEEFAGKLANLVADENCEAHILLALRDDSLHRLHALRKQLPSILNATLELRHLGECDVREAITGPVAVWNEWHSPAVEIDPDLADALIDELRPKDRDGRAIQGGRIELAYLQLALERIWDAEGGSNATALRTKTLTDRLEGLGEISRRHVEDVLGGLQPEKQAICTAVFDRLVTPSGGKILYPAEDLAKIARITPEQVTEVLAPLATGKTRLLRAVALPGQTDAHGYEILHDVLARPILEWTAGQQAERVKEQERERQEAEFDRRARILAEANADRLSIQRLGLFALLLIASLALFWAFDRNTRLEEATKTTNVLRLAAESSAILAGAQTGGIETAILKMIAAQRLADETDVDAASLAALDRLQDLVRWVGADVPVHAVAFSPDGQRIASGGRDNEVRLWDARTGQPLGEPLKGHQGAVYSVAFSPDGGRVASGSHDRTLRLWDAKTGQPIGAPLTGHDGAVLSVAFSPDGGRIASGSQDSKLRLWDVRTGRPIGEPVKAHSGAVYCVAFSPASEDERIVSGGEDSMVRLWYAGDLRSVGKPLQGHDGPVRSVAFSGDGKRVATGGDDKTVRLWDAETAQAIGAPLKGHESTVGSVAFSSDGNRIVSGGEDRAILLWNTGSLGRDPIRLGDGKIPNSRFAVSPDGQSIASAGLDRQIRLWDVKTGQPIGAPLKGHEGVVLSVAFSPDGERVISGSQDTTLRLWDVKTGQPTGTPLVGHKDAVYSVAFRPDGGRVASGSADKTLRLWDARTGEPIGVPLQGHEGIVLSVSFSPDGRRVVSGSADTTLRLWDAKTGRPIGAPLKGHQGAVLSVAFSPDGGRIVSGSQDATLRLWDARNGQPIGTPLKGHGGPVLSVGFSRDGKRIVSGGADNRLVLWDARKAERLGAPTGSYTSGVSVVAFSSDDRSIVSVGGNSTVRIWPGPTQWPVELCAKLTRNMTHQQWHDWVSKDIEYTRQCQDLPIPRDQPRRD